MKTLICKVAALCVALAVLAGCKVEMHSSLDEKAANEMMAALLSNGIAASKEARKDGVALLVGEGQFSEAVQLLSSLGLPRARFANIGEVFEAEGIVASPLQERAKLNFARSQEISEAIASIPGVVRVNVNIAEAMQETVFDEKRKPSASVVVLVSEAANSGDLVRKIKQIVAFAIPDIEYERVGVLITPVAARAVEQDYVPFHGVMIARDGVIYANALLAYAVGSTLAVFAALIWAASRRRANAAGAVA